MLRSVRGWLLLGVWWAAPIEPALPMGPPSTPQKPVTETLHGVAITDPYRWLEDQNSPETRAWIAQQQAYTDRYLASLANREQVSRRLSELIRVDDYSSPVVRGTRLFFRRQPGDKEQNQICWRNGVSGLDQVLVDANELSKSQPVTARILDVSRDGKLLVYGLQQGGEDEVSIGILDVDSSRQRTESMPKARYSGLSLLPDGSGFYYSKVLPAGQRVFYHAMGAEPGSDRLVFGSEYDSKHFVAGVVTPDGRYLILTVQTGWGTKTDVFVMPLGQDRRIQQVVGGFDGEFTPSYYDGTLYLLTTWKAPNRRILAVDLSHPEPSRWREVVQEQTDRIDEAAVCGGKLLLVYLHDVASRVRLCSLAGNVEREIELPTLGRVDDISADADQNQLFFRFESFAVPHTAYRIEVPTAKASVWWRAPMKIQPDTIAVQQVWFASRDGTRVPMFVVHRKDVALNGNAPTLLTAYGGFDVSLTPRYTASLAYWVEQGGVAAVPSLRGGGEFGEAWHRAGMLEKKQNVFDDFFAAAEYLQQNGYTRARRLGIEGMSNGGLLMGAAVTQRPELFGAVVCEYPLLDMIRYDRFKVARWWVPEYGSADDPKQFPYLLRYSPYQHVEKGVKYPAVLFITGDGDTRVDPLHARKMAALMQNSTGGDKPILLKYDTSSGHSGGKPLAVTIADTADTLAFLLDQLR